MTEPDPGPLDIDPDGRRIQILWWLAIGLLAIGLGACVAEGANGPPDPSFESRIAGFDEIAFSVQPAGEGLPSATEFCALDASTEEQRARGLMEVTDPELAGYAAMVFRFGDTDTTGGFYMRNTRIPLTVGFFDAGGALIGAADMDPCPDEVPECPTYQPPGPYRFAIEVSKGRFDAMGIGLGSVVQLLGDCGSG